ncbi:hypothetical protein VH86_24435 [Pantoea sp. BL1]|nr:hypothetical protein VH86_24435 [Pantoea sp. BL1]
MLLLWLWLLKGIFMRREVRADWRKNKAEPGRWIMDIRIRAERTGAAAPVFPARRAAVLPFRADRKHKAKPRQAARCRITFAKINCMAGPVWKRPARPDAGE